jgi:hypothetical protein
LKENFTDSIFEIHKEKEMADFRKWFVVLAMLALFVGTAAAQQNTAFSCVTVAQVTPTLRAEGITELVGDIVLTCTGGNPIAVGTAIPQANVIVTLTQPVTSRLASSSTGASEALLLVDEPNTPNLPAIDPAAGNFGSAATTSVCPNLTGCGAFAASAPLNPLVFGAGTTATAAVASSSATTATPTYNAFQGQVVGTYQVLFAGVPILPPATNGIVRTYRITNIRVSAGGANPLGGNLSAFSLVQAYISTSGPTSLPVTNNVLTVGFVQNSLTATATPVSTVFTQCNATGSITQAQTAATAATAPPNVAILSYAENFPSAFKTRVAPLSTAGTSYLTTVAGGTNPGLSAQNVPGVLYNSESGFVTSYPVGSGTFTAGLADFGTRFKAVFSNLPVGVTLYVSATNVDTRANQGGGFFTAAAAPTAIGGNASGSYALYTGSETGAFSGIATGGSAPPFVFGSSTLQAQSLGTTTASNTTLQAVWEVVNANVAQSETFNFAVWMVYTPGGTASAPTPTVTPATGGPSVTMSYAPVYVPNTTPAAMAASSTFPIPRFVGGTTSPLLTVVTCQTVLLFPYVTNMSGLETGIAISNTSLDPLTPATPQSQGFCRLHFYGSNGASVTQKPPTTFTCPGPQCLGPILPGNPAFQTTGTVTAATLATTAFGTDVTGYMFAVCDFQYAHGFAFISDSHLTNIAMGYLALVVNNGQTIARPAAQRGEALSN